MFRPCSNKENQGQTEKIPHSQFYEKSLSQKYFYFL